MAVLAWLAAVGFFAYLICEILERRKLTNSAFATAVFAISVIFAIASLYEIVEWIYAVSSSESAGGDFLGSQGDEWDAQKDMLADGLGGIAATSLYFFRNRS